MNVATIKRVSPLTGALLDIPGARPFDDVNFFSVAIGRYRVVKMSVKAGITKEDDFVRFVERLCKSRPVFAKYWRRSNYERFVFNMREYDVRCFIRDEKRSLVAYTLSIAYKQWRIMNMQVPALICVSV